MKKIILMAAVLGMVFTSCTNDNEDYDVKEQKSKQISFAQPVLSGMTRAGAVEYAPFYGDINPYKKGEANTGYPQSESFTVFGVRYTDIGTLWSAATPVIGTNQGVGEPTFFINGTTVQGWLTKTPHFFDDTYSYSFAAFSPSSIVNPSGAARELNASSATSATYNYDGVATTKGLLIKGYVPGKMGMQVDLMYAHRIVNQKSNSLGTDVSHGTDGNKTDVNYDGLNLKFNHALSSIHIKIGLDKDFEDLMTKIGAENDNYKNELKKFRITNITLKNVATKGNFSEENANAVVGSVSDGKPKWTLTEKDAVTYEFVKDVSGGLYIPTGTNGKGKDLTDASFTPYNTNNDKFAAGHQALLIPQPLTKIADTESSAELVGIKNKLAAQLEIKWTRPTNRPWAAAETSVEQVTTTIDLSKITTNNKWEMGKRYTYTILFSRDVIYVAPQVTDWTESSTDPATIVEIPVK